MKKLLSIISIFFLISTQISVAEPSKNAEWCAKGVKSSDYLACKAGPKDTNPTTGLAVGAVLLGTIAWGIVEHEEDDEVACEQTANGLVCNNNSSCTEIPFSNCNAIDSCNNSGGIAAVDGPNNSDLCCPDAASIPSGYTPLPGGC